MVPRRITILRTLAVVGLAGSVLAASCSTGGSDADPAVRDLRITEVDEWAAMFSEAGVEGTFAAHRVGTDDIRVHNPQRATTPAIPASTFKILNSLIALDTGVVADVDDAVPWDGVERSVAAWNRDHSLRTGIAVSAVWMYQQLARTIGSERMTAAVRSADYGNMVIGGPVDEFWLRGDLRISPIQQIDFLARLATDDLPFNSHDQAAVREILIRDRGADWTWGHKTGTALASQPVLGWLVGYTTHGEGTWVFAMNIDLDDRGALDAQIDPQTRLTLSRAILEQVGALPPRT